MEQSVKNKIYIEIIHFITNFLLINKYKIMEKEIWKIIDGTDSLYEVSNLGNIRKNGILQEIIIDKNGYCSVFIELGFGRRKFSLHRIVAYYFCDNDDKEHKNQVNHISGVKTDNRAINLEWCTPLQNQKHKINVLGKDLKGSKNPMFGKTGENSPVFKGFILQIDPNTNDILGKFAGSGEAARSINGIASNILRVLNKSNRKYHGYLWIRET